MIRPGEIYWADFDGAFPHPVVVVSKEALNRGHSVLAAVVTSARFRERSGLPHAVAIRFGLGKDCVIQAETLGPVRTEHLDLASGPIGRVDDRTFRDLVRAIGVVFDSECEPC